MAQMDAPHRYTSGNAWSGWHGFAGVLLFVVGFFNVIDGIVAIVEDDVVLASGARVTVLLDVTTWGWVHVLLGLLLAAAGIGIFLGQTWARVVGVVAVAVNMVTQMMNVPAYPVWSLMVIALDVVIIWALTVHGEARENA